MFWVLFWSYKMLNSTFFANCEKRSVISFINARYVFIGFVIYRMSSSDISADLWDVWRKYNEWWNYEKVSEPVRWRIKGCVWWGELWLAFCHQWKFSKGKWIRKFAKINSTIFLLSTELPQIVSVRSVLHETVTDC